MLQSFRSASKSIIGTAIIGFIGLMIVIGFAMGDIQSLSLGSGFSSSTLAKVGSVDVTERDMSTAMQRRLAEVRQQNPEAGYSALAADFDPILNALIDLRALEAFALEHGFVVSNRVIDAEIANLPGVKGLDGRVSTQAYQAFLSRQQMTDAELRQLISSSILQRLLLTPAATNARIPLGMATPYASMLLEERRGEIALVPASRFTEGLNPTDAQVQQFYARNRNRYMIPEQRVLRLARIGPDQVANVSATEQEITAYYNANQAQYGAKDIRVISQAVVPDQNVARQIAQRARGGQSFVDAVKPAGLSAADVSVGPQTRQEFTGAFGEEVAAAAFRANAGAIVGPIQSNLGWHVVKIDAAQTQPGKSLGQVRDEIAARITSDKRQNAFADLVDKVQDAIDGGANFEEAARAANLAVIRTPTITASGTARGDASYKFPDELAAALKSGFELAPTDEPVIDQLAGDQGFVLVSPAEVIPAAPAPLEGIRDQVRQDWIRSEAMKRAQAAANAIAKAAATSSLAEAARGVNSALPPIQQPRLRRIQLTEMGPSVPAPLRVLFSTAKGKVQTGPDPEGRGFFVVKVNEIIPGNALNQPSLISQVQSQFSEPIAQEYAQQFLAAAEADVGVERNATAIEAAR
ncbi:MAG TPA: peptidyl-prolyl cis-trans isomerase, partial [Sphingomicrobium sp.]|nr:peptidyl-prolyl cis-trans isomerase [Sphingomicrobium sp.]